MNPASFALIIKVYLNVENKRCDFAFQKQTGALQQWMGDMEQFLSSDEMALADADTLQLQLGESKVIHYIIHCCRSYLG